MKKLFLLFVIFSINFSFLFANWERCVNGLDQEHISCIALDSNSIYVGTYDSGIFISSNDGDSWVSSSFGIDDLFIQAININNGLIFVGTVYQGGLFTSTNGGISWFKNYNRLWGCSINVITIDRNNIFVALNGGGIHSSSDNGNTWIDRIDDIQTCGDLIKPFGIAAKGDTILACSYLGRIYFSPNFGKDWYYKKNTPVGAFDLILSINSDSLYNCSYKGLYLSTDYGDSWIPKNNGLIKKIQTIKILGNYIFAGTDSSGVYLSTNKGDSWKAINYSLMNLHINTLAINGKYIFAGTNSGLYRAELRDFGIVNDVSETKNNELSFSIFPNPVSDYFNISLDIDSPFPVRINIFNQLGISVLEKSFTGTNCKIETKDLPSGVYLCSINYKGNLLSKKLIIIK